MVVQQMKMKKPQKDLQSMIPKQILGTVSQQLEKTAGLLLGYHPANKTDQVSD